MTTASPRRTKLDSVVVRFAGDSGDGMQLTGAQFSTTSALMGNDLSTFPDFPAEIRAPAGTTYGVSGFQVHLADHDIRTPGDCPDVLVVMNPAALKVNIDILREGGLLIINESAFTKTGLSKAGYDHNPLDDEASLSRFRVLKIEITKLTLEAVKPFGLGAKDGSRCKNLWTLGLLYWLFGRDRTPTTEWLKQKFKKKPEIADANIAALNAGHVYGETAELPSDFQIAQVPRATDLPKGTYRSVDGNQAIALGLVVGAARAGLDIFYGSYPITPASSLLHNLAALKSYGVKTFQAEDEIAAVCAAIGASYGGALGVTGTSGPGVALKSEAIGLAISTELPLVVVDVQRGGPSTGLPTKTEQSDLFQAMWGRNGDAPLAVISASTPGNAFEVAVEAVRMATSAMTPVIILSDGYVANGAEPWRIPDLNKIEGFRVAHHNDVQDFHPFKRDEKTLARVWALPGTPGLEHRIGGLEKNYDSGHISYDPANHQHMTDVRAEKIARLADTLPKLEFELGSTDDGMVVVGWGSTYGAIYQAVDALRSEGKKVAMLHLSYLSPFQKELGGYLNSFGKVLVPEMNAGMMATVLRATYGIKIGSFSKVAGQPFKIAELKNRIVSELEGIN